ncbi:LysM peptidoglycan-binding domain-containing protein [Nocardioides sediminis]|uniref:LysM peptidoglycan-binding domain-containing protein n=1 Tax=Nocardioides sediminis TaxID=433648 RepID=UPI0019029705|nr:LysM domain-containing protein [Nocardioides sediminis]
MSRGNGSPARCLAVWLAATLASGVVHRLAGAAAASLLRPETWHGSFEDLLVAVCALALLVSAAHLWLVTTATTIGLVRGRTPRDAGGLARRLVLVACGAAVVAGVSGPAVAGQGGGDRLAGLPLPDRATAGAPAAGEVAMRTPRPGRATPTAAPARALHRAPGTVDGRADDRVVVREGDSLWSIAAARLPRSAGPGEVDRAWRAVYAANRAEVGTDPGLIRPGQRLHVPPLGDARDDR